MSQGTTFSRADKLFISWLSRLQPAAPSRGSGDRVLRVHHRGHMPDALEQFSAAKYLNLETFRKTGIGVRTPVWFAQQDQTVFYVYSEADAGKVKRIRNNSHVRVAPCNFRGRLRGSWVEGHAHLCSPDEALRGQQLLRSKYGWLKITGDFFSRLMKHKQVLIAIELS